MRALALLLSRAVLAALLVPGLARAQASHIWRGPHTECTAANLPNAWHCGMNWSDETVPTRAARSSSGLPSSTGRSPRSRASP